MFKKYFHYSFVTFGTLMLLNLKYEAQANEMELENTVSPGVTSKPKEPHFELLNLASALKDSSNIIQNLFDKLFSNRRLIGVDNGRYFGDSTG